MKIMNEKTDNIGELRRAYELLKRIYENNYIISTHLKLEIDELMTPQWLKEIDEDNGYKKY
ncbi:hypothetical protein HRF87_25895 [Bacillus sp. CRN 9]|nr:hypothetical protein [Bacillus sp. CRN 9]